MSPSYKKNSRFSFIEVKENQKFLLIASKILSEKTYNID